MGVYINGIGIISPQKTEDNQKFLEEIVALEQSYFPIAEPIYKEYIDPRELRRMSKIIRNGIVAGKIAMADADLSMPDAILTGTGLGCAIDTEKFLISMIENQETLLTPTSFIQSTHNTLGGSIAIGLGCHNYNMTYVHRGFSFESALLDAELMIEDGEIQNALVGGFDEMTDNHIQLLQATEMYKRGAAIAGQGAGFFVLENQQKDKTYAQLLALETIYQTEIHFSSIKSQLEQILVHHQVNPEKLVVMMGYNGLASENIVYDQLSSELFPEQTILQFKHLCGEYYTASAFAVWMASQILKKQFIPDSVIRSGKQTSEIQHVLIYNQFQEKEHSLILLGKC